MAPTFLAMPHSLSLRMPMNFLVVCVMLFIASNEMPLVSAASPNIASRSFRPGGTIVRVGPLAIGGDAIVVMAGPCSLENRDQIEQCASLAARTGARVIRGGAFKPSNSPYEFQGLGAEGLEMLRTAADRHGLLVVGEVMDKAQIPLIAEYTDILQVGARNMQNFNLLRELGKQSKPVLLKRGIAASIEDLLLSAEHI